MTLDEPVRQLLAFSPDSGDPQVPPAERRRIILNAADELYRQCGAPADPAVITEELIIVPGGHVRVRTYRPTTPAAGPRPLHMFLHGGGWWLSTVDELVNDAICRARAAHLDCVVVAVDYRLAPEHPFPVPMQDCYAAMAFIVDHADRWGIDPDNVSIGGVSAGANLAAAVALKARDRNGPRLNFVLLEVPALDLTLSTMRESGIGDDFGITVADMQQSIDFYVAEPETATKPYASPLLADDLRGFPPTHVMVAEFDPLRLEGHRFAERLAQAGVPVTLDQYPGAVHGSLNLTGVWPPARQWWSDAIAALRRSQIGRRTDGRPADAPVGNGR